MARGILESVATSPPDVVQQDVADAVQQQFGLRGDYTALVSERDQNFRLTLQDGTRYVVKVVSSAEDMPVTEFQIAALMHLEAKGIRGVPIVVANRSGEAHGWLSVTNGSRYCLRVVTWVNGRLLVDVHPCEETAHSLGERLAQLDRALRDFTHAGDRQELLWDTQRAGELRQLLECIDDEEVRDLVEEALDVFDQHLQPRLSRLSSQVIHNDANPENILLNPDHSVAGLIDFGDMLRAPRVVEVSTAASYLRCRGDNPARLIAALVASYQRDYPLAGDELHIIFDLVRTRLAMSLSILYWRIGARSDDDPYRLKSLAVNNDAFEFLKNLTSMGRSDFDAEILKKISI